MAVSLRAAHLTDGDVDPTVGGALAELGYDRDFAELARDEAPTQGEPADARAGAPAVGVRVIPGWRSLRVDVDRQRLTVPAGVQLDLGATVKGWAADRAAARISERLRCGVLVSLGGDIATGGTAPEGGWRVRVQDVTGHPDEPPNGPAQTVVLQGGALATSSTTARRWERGGAVLHHILDPRNGLPEIGRAHV